MNNKNKLKVLIAVLFCFIIALVVLLIYAKNTYTPNENPVNNTISTNSSSSASTVKESIDLKLYFFDADDYENVKEIRTVSIDKKLYQDDISAAINEVLSSTNIKINKAVINGDAITVDLSKEVALKFNSGSAGGITYTNILAMTILNLPNIQKLEVTVDGESEVVADHFNFNGTFNKSEDDKIYTFIESEKKSNVLQY